MVYKVKDKCDFDSQLSAAGEKLVVVDFFATWCGPCKIIAPKLEELAEEYSEKAVVLKVDVDACDDIAAEYKITSMPTFVFIKHGKVVGYFSGANSATLEKNFAKFVSLGSSLGTKPNDEF